MLHKRTFFSNALDHEKNNNVYKNDFKVLLKDSRFKCHMENGFQVYNNKLGFTDVVNRTIH